MLDQILSIGIALIPLFTVGLYICFVVMLLFFEWPAAKRSQISPAWYVILPVATFASTWLAGKFFWGIAGYGFLAHNPSSEEIVNWVSATSALLIALWVLLRLVKGRVTASYLGIGIAGEQLVVANSP